VNSRFHRDRQASACIVYPDRFLAASGALAGLDVVLLRSAARFQASFQALVRDSPLAMVEKAPQVALQSHQVPQPPGAQKMAELQTEPQDVFPQALQFPAR
jgi:hypothetical protein